MNSGSMYHSNQQQWQLIIPFNDSQHLFGQISNPLYMHMQQNKNASDLIQMAFEASFPNNDTSQASIASPESWQYFNNVGIQQQVAAVNQDSVLSNTQIIQQKNHVSDSTGISMGFEALPDSASPQKTITSPENRLNFNQSSIRQVAPDLVLSKNALVSSDNQDDKND